MGTPTVDQAKASLAPSTINDALGRHLARQGAARTPRSLSSAAAPAHPTSPACRDLEWFLAAVMVGWAGILTLPGDSLQAPTYSAFDFLGFGEEVWAYIFGIVGATRLIALYINGRRPRSYHVRVAASILGGTLWGVLAITLYIGSSHALHAVSPGVAFYGMAAVAELRNARRAAYDVRYRQR